MFKLGEWTDTSTKYDDPVQWIASGIAACTTMMGLEIPHEFKGTTWSQRREALREALREVLRGIEKGQFNALSYRPKEYVYSLRGWFVEGILDFLFADEKIWKSDKWNLREVRKHTPQALAFLIEDIID